MRKIKPKSNHCATVLLKWTQGASINADHPEGVNALMYGAAGAHLGVVQVNWPMRPYRRVCNTTHHVVCVVHCL